jgi:hypothetical protein
MIPLHASASQITESIESDWPLVHRRCVLLARWPDPFPLFAGRRAPLDST